jgi:hypothetical protein
MFVLQLTVPCCTFHAYNMTTPCPTPNLPRYSFQLVTLSQMRVRRIYDPQHALLEGIGVRARQSK